MEAPEWLSDIEERPMRRARFAAAASAVIGVVLLGGTANSQDLRPPIPIVDLPL